MNSIREKLREFWALGDECALCGHTIASSTLPRQWARALLHLIFGHFPGADMLRAWRFKRACDYIFSQGFDVMDSRETSRLREAAEKLELIVLDTRQLAEDRVDVVEYADCVAQTACGVEYLASEVIARRKLSAELVPHFESGTEVAGKDDDARTRPTDADGT